MYESAEVTMYETGRALTSLRNRWLSSVSSPDDPHSGGDNGHFNIPQIACQRSIISGSYKTGK
jgi:hypothetical protein